MQLILQNVIILPQAVLEVESCEQINRPMRSIKLAEFQNLPRKYWVVMKVYAAWH